MEPSNNAGFADWANRQQQEYQRKRSAWLKASVLANYDSDKVRVDAYGSIIIWDEYGQRTQFGWEIDHELPKSVFPGMAAAPANLRALHWSNNRKKSNTIDLASLSRLLGGN